MTGATGARWTRKIGTQRKLIEARRTSVFPVCLDAKRHILDHHRMGQKRDDRASTGGLLNEDNWIDFKALRAKLDFESRSQTLRRRGQAQGQSASRLLSAAESQGKKNSPSFSANLERGIFQCFGCGAKGNVLEFAAMMEKVDPKAGTALRKAASETAKAVLSGNCAMARRMKSLRRKSQRKPN